MATSEGIEQPQRVTLPAGTLVDVFDASDVVSVSGRVPYATYKLTRDLTPEALDAIVARMIDGMVINDCSFVNDLRNLGAMRHVENASIAFRIATDRTDVAVVVKPERIARFASAGRARRASDSTRRVSE